jgi:AraC-like DNA-binding protein
MTYATVGQQVCVLPRQATLFWAAIPHQVTEVSGSGQIHCIYVSLQEFMHWNLPVRFRHELMHGGFLMSLEEDVIEMIAVDRWWRDFQQRESIFHRQALDEIRVCVQRMALAGWHLNDSRNTPVRKATCAGMRGMAHVEAMADFISAHFHERLSLSEVAGHIGLHPNYATTLFKETVGLSISEYITRHRLSHAQAMLLNTNEKILAIAMDCGFGSLSRFYEAFRVRLGTTPRRYREAWIREISLNRDRKNLTGIAGEASATNRPLCNRFC